MADNRCLTVFASAAVGLGRARNIDELAPDCACERCVVSEYNSTPVHRSETLARLVVDPTHVYREVGSTPRLNSSFFSDAASVGASTIRMELATAAEYIAAAKEIVEDGKVTSDGTPKKIYGIAVFRVETVKDVMHSLEASLGTRTVEAFCVYATGDQTKPSHADIMVNKTSVISRSKSNRAYTSLAKNDQILIKTVDEFKEIADLSQWA